MKLISHFRPRYLLMAGIAAGIGLNFGDVVIAEQSWDYGSGKIWTPEKNQSSFAPSPSYIPLDAGLKEKVEFFSSHRRSVIAAIQERWRGNPVDCALKVAVGPMASGAAVLENESAVKGIREHNRKVIAIEMETYGMYLAARASTSPRPQAMSAKSICDFGIPPKTDEHQRYAAHTSANFLYEFALDQLAPTSKRGG